MTPETGKTFGQIDSNSLIFFYTFSTTNEIQAILWLENLDRLFPDHILVAKTFARGHSIVWQRFCELCQMKNWTLSVCVSIHPSMSCPPSHSGADKALIMSKVKMATPNRVVFARHCWPLCLFINRALPYKIHWLPRDIALQAFCIGVPFLQYFAYLGFHISEVLSQFYPSGAEISSNVEK